VRDAQIDDIARAVGINRAVIYRHFCSKEELFTLAFVGYLEELDARLTAGETGEVDPVERLGTLTGVFVDFCFEHPAFVDGILAILRQPYPALVEEVGEETVLRLGQALSAAFSQVAGVLRDGSAQGVFRIEDPDYTASYLCMQAIGPLRLARVGASVREVAPGVPGLLSVPASRIRQTTIAATVATALGLAPLERCEAAPPHSGEPGEDR